MDKIIEGKILFEDDFKLANLLKLNGSKTKYFNGKGMKIERHSNYDSGK